MPCHNRISSLFVELIRGRSFERGCAGVRYTVVSGGDLNLSVDNEGKQQYVNLTVKLILIDLVTLKL